MNISNEKNKESEDNINSTLLKIRAFDIAELQRRKENSSIKSNVYQNMRLYLSYLDDTNGYIDLVDVNRSILDRVMRLVLTFPNFKNVIDSTNKAIPFGVAQIGKAFRNEVTPGKFIFRVREFEQMELEFFVKPGADEEWHKKWVDIRVKWWKEQGVGQENMELYDVPSKELAHYSKATVDIISDALHSFTLNQGRNRTGHLYDFNDPAHFATSFGDMLSLIDSDGLGQHLQVIAHDLLHIEDIVHSLR